MMMSRQTDPTVLHSSIALLQERFKQLEKIKEKREERELLRLFTETAEQARIPSACFDQSTLFHPDLRLPSRPPRASLSLWPDLQSKPQDFHAVEKPLFPALLPFRGPSRPTMNDTEVDTSLHL